MTIEKAIELTMTEITNEQSPTSRHVYRWMARTMATLFAGRELHTITRREVQTWVTKRRMEVAPSTLNHELSFLSRLYRVAWDHGEDVTTPCKGLRKPRINNKRQRILSDAEGITLQAIMGRRAWSLVVFAIHTGLRRLEQIRLKPEQIQFSKKADENGQPVEIAMAWIASSKTGIGRNCVLNPVAAKIARAWIAGEPGEWVFLSSCTGQRINVANNLSKSLRAACKKAGIQGLRWHDLRHTAASRAAANGCEIHEIQALLGHSSSKMSERYTHWGNGPLYRAAMSICGKNYPTF